jgi:hypothetical protein
MPIPVLKNQTGRRGSIIVELAVSVSLLVLLMAGAGDFARIFYNAITVANASGTGAFYGAQTTIKSVSHGETQTMAVDDTRNLEGTTSASEMICDCPDGTSLDSCVTGTCPGYGQPRIFVRTVVQQSFDTYLPWPGVPDNVPVVRETIMRVQ